MTSAELLRNLKILRSQVELTVAGIAAIEASLEEMRPQPPPPAEVDGKCQHPEGFVQPAPVMGKPARLHCARCGKFLNEGD